MSACPKCRSDRLKSAPSPVIALAGPLVGKRRYRCADCGWTGWKQRLRRRSSAAQVSLLQRGTPETPAVWFGIGVLTFIIITTVLLMRSCEPAGPPDQLSLLLQSCVLFT